VSSTKKKKVYTYKMNMMSGEQTLVKAIKFLSVFYKLVPHGREIPRSYIDSHCNFSPKTSRRWLECASRVIPLVSTRYPGSMRNDGGKVPWMYTWKTMD